MNLKDKFVKLTDEYGIGYEEVPEIYDIMKLLLKQL